MNASRLAPLSGLLGIVLLDMGWFWDPAAPLDQSDRATASWYASHGNGAWLVAAALATLAVPCFWVFSSYVTARITAAGGSVRARKVVSVASRTFALSVLIVGPLYAAVPLTRVLTDVGDPSPAVSRFVGAAEFSEFILLSTLAAVVFAVSVSVAGWSTRAVPRWLSVAGIPLALIMLANPVLPMAGITLWFLLASITLAVRPLRDGAVRTGSRDALAVPA